MLRRSFPQQPLPQRTSASSSRVERAGAPEWHARLTTLVAAATSALLLIALVAIAGQAQTSRSNVRDPAEENVYVRQVEQVAPKAVDAFKAATAALDSNNYQEAVRLFEEVLQQTPELDTVQRRLGLALVGAGSVPRGTALIETAYAKTQSPENAGVLAQVLALPANNAGSSANLARAMQLITFAARTRPQDPYYQLLRAQIALESNNQNAFREAQEALASSHPDLMPTHFYNAIRAAMDTDWEKAEAEIKKAGDLGLPQKAVREFLDSGIHTRAQVWRYLHLSLYVVAAWLAGLALLFACGKVFSSLTLRSLERADPNGAATPREESLRTWYRRLITAAGGYYYISLPVVIFLVLAVVGSATYGFLLIGWIAVKLLLILAFGALVTIYRLIRTLFVKVKSEDPGRALARDEAPALWALTGEVAETLGTRPIDEIRVTPGCEMAVYETGGAREKMQDRGRRTLILGVGLLNGFRTNAFRAVLAHEYGHFSHRDTAGGDVALRVRNDMLKFAYAMVAEGQAVWYNVAFQFLRVYDFLFRRVSHGATRLQEVLADRVAVRHYSAAAFEEGLRHVVRRDVEFGYVASKEIEAARSGQRALSNLYEVRDLPGIEDEKKITDAVSTIVNRKTSEDDTHPSPLDRFRLAARIAGNPVIQPAGEIWELFADRAALTSEMSRVVEARMKAAVEVA